MDVLNLKSMEVVCLGHELIALRETISGKAAFKLVDPLANKSAHIL